MLIQHKMTEKSNIVAQADDKKCQINRIPLKSKMCSDKKCQDNISVHKQPVKPQMCGQRNLQ